MIRSVILAPELLFDGERLVPNGTVGVDIHGRFCAPASLPAGTPTEPLPGRALLPGLVNAHSHAFQRLIRGRTEFLAGGHARDDFWTWRERMYRAANALGPEDVYVASRQAFLEMALAGITTVGEFHYLHHAPDGTRYAEPELLALEVIRAARDVGLRIVLLRVGYARAGHGLPENPLQRRFYDVDVGRFQAAAAALAARTKEDPGVTVGLAPHSVRAVPRGWLEALAGERLLPVHMHVAEQAAEVQACLKEHGRRPVELLADVGLLSERFTAVHGVELSADERRLLGRAKARVCACPSTERNLGDGVVEADLLAAEGVRLCLGTDSQAEVDLLGEARQLEGNLRLLRKRRAVLDAGQGDADGLARGLWATATLHGALSLGVPAGVVGPGHWADAFTLDLEHPSLAGFTPEAGLAQLLFGAQPGAVRDVYVGGRALVQDGRHPLAAESRRAFSALVRRVME